MADEPAARAACVAMGPMEGVPVAVAGWARAVARRARAVAMVAMVVATGGRAL